MAARQLLRRLPNVLPRAGKDCTKKVRLQSSDAKIAYGAPFTNSITLLPASIAGGTSTVPGADQHMFCVSIPDYPLSKLTVLGRDKLDYVGEELAKKIGAKSVTFVVNGRKVTASSEDIGPRTLNSLFNRVVEVEVDGVRYSINEGNTLNALGKASKRSLVTTYAFIGVGGVGLLAGCLWMWKQIVPVGSQRRF